MGLTIHYRLSTDRTEADDARRLVQEFRRLAQQLLFQEVGTIFEFQDEQCRRQGAEDEHAWLKIQAGQYLQVDGKHLRVEPLHILAFTTLPGAGCEPANFGLARFPAFVSDEHDSRKQTRTNLHGWRWRSFCKTQYASDPAAGGSANFVRCHLSVISLLDAIKNRQLAEVEVSDESDYWEHRDVHRLAAVVGEWNEMIAAVAGQLKDAVSGFELEAPITNYSTFEHLEARGHDRLKKQEP